jgi:hypothetical protein
MNLAAGHAAALPRDVKMLGSPEHRLRMSAHQVVKITWGRAVAAAASVSPDDMMITLYEVPGENISFDQGTAQRANAVARA